MENGPQKADKGRNYTLEGIDVTKTKDTTETKEMTDLNKVPRLKKAPVLTKVSEDNMVSGHWSGAFPNPLQHLSSCGVVFNTIVLSSVRCISTQNALRVVGGLFCSIRTPSFYHDDPPGSTASPVI